MIQNTNTSRRGFTLIELLVTTSIILLLAGFGLASWQTFNQQQALDAAAQDLKNNLRQVRGWAMAVRKVACSSEIAGYEVSFNIAGGYQVREKCGDGSAGAWQNFSYQEGISGSSGISFTFLPLTGATTLASDTTIILEIGDREKPILIRKNGEIE